MTLTLQSRPDADPVFQAKDLKWFQVVPSSFGRGTPYTVHEPESVTAAERKKKTA